MRGGEGIGEGMGVEASMRARTRRSACGCAVSQIFTHRAPAPPARAPAAQYVCVALGGIPLLQPAFAAKFVTSSARARSLLPCRHLKYSDSLLFQVSRAHSPVAPASPAMKPAVMNSHLERGDKKVVTSYI